MDFGLKKLISTSYAPESNYDRAFYEPTLFETESPIYDEDKSRFHGRVFTLTPEDLSGDGKINLDDLQWEYLEGDGDFRSEEVTALRDEADLVITNPPFSLFKDFVGYLIAGNVQFVTIGTMNAITYKEVFPSIQDNRLWLGVTHFNKGMYFGVPEAFEYSDSYNFDREQAGVKVARVSGVCWFTNVDHGRRHEPLQLMSEEDNRKYNKKIAEVGYPKYDNYDAIEVGRVDAIPSDYDEMMGVPISFLDKYNPDQFKIVGITKTWDDASGLKKKTYPTQLQVSKKGEESRVGKLNDGAAIKVLDPPDRTHYRVGEDLFVQPYARIIIRRRG
jgi:hypothetical protein